MDIQLSRRHPTTLKTLSDPSVGQALVRRKEMQHKRLHFFNFFDERAVRKARGSFDHHLAGRTILTFLDVDSMFRGVGPDPLQREVFRGDVG